MVIARLAIGKEWRKCFSFIPRLTIDGEIVWLGGVEKHRFYCPDGNVRPSDWVEYRIAGE